MPIVVRLLLLLLPIAVVLCALVDGRLLTLLTLNATFWLGLKLLFLRHPRDNDFGDAFAGTIGGLGPFLYAGATSLLFALVFAARALFER